MQLLYIDASGDPGPFRGKNSKHYVLCGVSMSYKDWKFITEDVRAIMSKYFERESIPEIHSHELVRGRPPFENIDHQALTSDLTNFLRSAHITLFGAVIDKNFYLENHLGPPNTITNKSLEEVVNRFHIYLQRHKSQGMIISDASTEKFDTGIRSTYDYFRTQGTTYVKLNRVIDTIFFTPSETSIGIQLADFVAYSVKRKFENEDDTIFSGIESKFDHSNGRMVGLKHIG